MPQILRLLFSLLTLFAFLSVHVPSTSPFALAREQLVETQETLPDEAEREAYRASGGNDVVHQIWAQLRELEPTVKESYTSLVPSDFVGTAWYYTKVVLKAMFMNAPASKPVIFDERGYFLQPALQKALDHLEASAAYGDTDAMYLLAEMSMHGNFTHPRRPENAFYWYFQLATETGNSTAQNMLGLLYATGIGGVRRDQAKALLYHDLAAEQGNVRSEMTLAFRYHMGIGTSRDCNKAVEYYKRVADKAMKHWQSGLPGGLSLPRNSYRWVEATGGAYGEGASASTSGPNAPANGGFQSNVEDILEYLSLRESSGDLGATYQLGKHYYDPPRGYKRNLRAAQRQFMKIARTYWGKDGKVSPRAPEGIDKIAGMAAAYIGRMFLRGEGMEQNYEKAITWFKRGISNGDSYAQYHLGLMYRDGIGVSQDGARAGALLKSAAEQGSVVAQSAVGVMFLDQGDVDTAGRYFELAASHGNMEALYYLAELTNLGVGRERVCGLAAVYYKLVAERAEGLHSSFLEANNAYERGNYEKAFIPMIMAAEQGYEHAQANVAHLLDQHTSYLSVTSIPFLSQKPPSAESRLLNNLELALVYFTRSAKQQNTDSLVKMGDYYLAGLVPLAAGNSPPSGNTPPLGHDPSFRGPSMEPDIEKATTCYTSAAEGQHSAQALWNLGWLHENGLGSVKQDFHMAKRYYDLAYEMNKDAAYLPVKLALLKLRLRSWWNGVSGGKVNPIRDDDEESNKKPKTFWEWFNKFLDNFEEMDAQEAARAAQQADNEMDWLADPGTPGGDAEYAARADRGNAGGYDGGDDWEDFDDGLVESLIIIALAGALALLVYARQQQQQQGRNNANANNGQGQMGGVQPIGQGQGQARVEGQQQAQPPPPQQQQDGQAQQNRGMFPQPGDPDFNNWVAGGVGH